MRREIQKTDDDRLFHSKILREEEIDDRLWQVIYFEVDGGTKPLTYRSLKWIRDEFSSEYDVIANVKGDIGGELRKLIPNRIHYFRC